MAMMRSTLSSSPTKPSKGILKNTSFIDVRADLEAATRHDDAESPEAWFKRILRAKQLSPLDLCDLFCYGDAAKHRFVPLPHICQVLYELEPSAETYDPLTDVMEEFLYRFAFTQDGNNNNEILVDIKEALRSLDIWLSVGTGNSQPSSPSKSPQKPLSPVRAAMLQAKTGQLQRVITQLQNENVRLSQALARDTKPSSSEEDEREATRPPSPLKIAIKTPGQPLGSTAASAQRSTSAVSSAKNVVTKDERELITIAQRLQYSGVKQLETELQQSQPSGFVSLKHLRWLLAHEHELEISEAQLMELCLGMNFNAQGQLDYREWIHVLLDILVYESPVVSPSKKAQRPKATPSTDAAGEATLNKLREYLRGFQGSSAHIRARIEHICEKYDLEGNNCLSIAEMTRVLQQELAQQHPIKLKCPLTTAETTRLVQHLASPADAESKDAFVYYPGVLAAIFDAQPSQKAQKHVRVLEPTFWEALRSSLCPRRDAERGLEQQIHKQLCKILVKLDPKHSFRISQRHFHRVFDQHWSTNDLDLLSECLSQPLGASTSTKERSVRYDVLMKLVFGAPDLRDGVVLKNIQTKCQQDDDERRERLAKMLRLQGGSYRLSFAQVHELLTPVVNLTELLYILAHLDELHEHKVSLQRLWTFLTEGSSKDEHSKEPETSVLKAGEDFGQLRGYLRLLCDDHDLEFALLQLVRPPESDFVRPVDLEQTILAHLRVLRLPADARALVTRPETIQRFLRHLGQRQEAPNAPFLRVSAFIEALVDWPAMAHTLSLPERLVDVKKMLEAYDWDKDGAIGVEDWRKAWKQLAPRTERMEDWLVRVLLRRFANARQDKRRPALDYARVLVFLVECQQEHTRELLQKRVIDAFQEKCAGAKTPVSTFHLEKLFESVDRDGKGYFTLQDLQAFLLDELEDADEKEDRALRSLLMSGHGSTALESVMTFLGQIAPTTAYAHLNGQEEPHSRRPRSASPTRSSTSGSPAKRQQRRASCATPRVVKSGDPLTPCKLKHTLRAHHNIEVSTHLVGQFLLYLGAPTSHFLELRTFARWLAPLSVDLQIHVKQLVKRMLVQSKAGGGQIQFDRFLQTVQRRVIEMGGENAIHAVRASLFLTVLHQLNIPLRKVEMAQLVRHFGMENERDELEPLTFLTRLYELSLVDTSSLV
ncbi:hypothetical protein Poli38472_004820 [Pythium oligandrum]|uniref:EF-hand domain-containing protein n=1 Tax=Pythium oligandrum TaxID=41045 RepID=A0A8K1CAJ6_PYTOL|nr:hypothetical protein Poli38472_004820 [Pythium oligandrum]|eukprot:TMW59751.1 hypothetical protein Poli38472_004820 [Pythium oligandrum]